MAKTFPPAAKKTVTPMTRADIDRAVRSSRAVVKVPRKRHALPKGFAKSQAAFAGPDPRARVAPPSWFVKAAKRGKAPEEILRMLARHVTRGLPLCEARVVLNEIGRAEGGAVAIRRLFTQRAFFDVTKGRR